MAAPAAPAPGRAPGSLALAMFAVVAVVEGVAVAAAVAVVGTGAATGSTDEASSISIKNNPVSARMADSSSHLERLFIAGTPRIKADIPAPPEAVELRSRPLSTTVKVTL